MGDDSFGGEWRVRETVFSPAGERLGEVVQIRRLEDAGGGRILVLQDCEPDGALRDAGHPMAAFAGHHVFTLSSDGPTRHYHGPAVVGAALTIGDGALIGRGVWPAFGWSFASWSVVVAPDRQVTGGRFHRGGTPMATIVGVAAPRLRAGGGEEPTALERPAPELGAIRWPGEIARTWRGTLCRVDGSGRMLGQQRAARRYLSRFEWEAEDVKLAMTERDDALALRGAAGGEPLYGFARRFGWLLESEAVVGADTILESTEIVDEAGGHLVVLQRWLVDQTLQRVEVLRLQPERES